MSKAIKLGNKVRDTITGFAGILIGRTEWMYGCNRIGIQPEGLHEGKPVDAEWFDEQRVELVEATPVKVSPNSTATSGGPKRDPRIRRHEP